MGIFDMDVCIFYQLFDFVINHAYANTLVVFGYNCTAGLPTHTLDSLKKPHLMAFLSILNALY